jgi:cytochrome c biogenesis protein CcmG, thiol:disulfide interchange protein DsbE
VSRPLRLGLGIAVAAAAIAALIVFGLSSSSTPAGGRPAPALPNEALVGSDVTIPAMLAKSGKRPLLVVFWASWCGSCMREAPAVESFAASAAGRGRIVGVDWSDARSGAVGFIRRYRWTFPVVRDAEGTVGNDYRLTGLPETFVLNASGRISAELHGPQTASSLAGALRAAEAAA